MGAKSPEQVPGWQFEINNGWGDYEAPAAIEKFLQKVKASDIVEEEVADGEGEDAKQVKTATGWFCEKIKYKLKNCRLVVVFVFGWGEWGRKLRFCRFLDKI